jgi:hypothetical protein
MTNGTERQARFVLDDSRLLQARHNAREHAMTLSQFHQSPHKSERSSNHGRRGMHGAGKVPSFIRGLNSDVFAGVSTPRVDQVLWNDNQNSSPST